MEIIGFAAGWQNHLKEWQDLVGTIFCTYGKAKKKGKKKEETLSRVIVSPMMPLRIICPKEHLETVLGIIMPNGNRDHFREKSKKVNIAMNMMRKSMGLKKLPKDWKEKNHPITQYLKTLAVGFHPIGIKEDEIARGDEKI